MQAKGIAGNFYVRPKRKARIRRAAASASGSSSLPFSTVARGASAASGSGDSERAARAVPVEKDRPCTRAADIPDDVVAPHAAPADGPTGPTAPETAALEAASFKRCRSESAVWVWCVLRGGRSERARTALLVENGRIGTVVRAAPEVE